MAFLNWYFLIFYSISLSCGLLIFRTIRTPKPRLNGWLYKALITLSITWGCNFASMRLAATVGGIAWVFLVLIPSLGARQIQNLMYHQKYKKASFLAWLLRYLHPMDGWWEQPKIIETLHLSKLGKTEQAKQILDSYTNSRSPVAPKAIAMNYALQLDWQGLLQWLQTKPGGIRDPLLLVYYCRALGETGHLHELLGQIEQVKKSLSRGDRKDFYLVQLFACAFCGEVKLAEKLLAGNLSFYAPELKKFWLAIAWYGAGEKRVADKQLQALIDSPNPNFQEAIAARLANPPQPAQKLLKPESYPLIANLTRAINQEEIDRSYQSLLERRPIHKQGLSVNLFLVAANFSVFIAGIIFNFRNGANAFIDTAGFIPVAVLDGEWWRMFTATFIHIDWSHLFTNLLSLYLLGGFAEKHLGKKKYLLIYLASGVGAMLALLGLVSLAQVIDFSNLPRWTIFLTDEIRYSYRQWVGASGAIMGMIGAIAVILFRGWRKNNSEAARKQFQLISLIMIIQFALDLTSPNVSFYSHFLGLWFGVALTWLLTRRSAKLNQN